MALLRRPIEGGRAVFTAMPEKAAGSMSQYTRLFLHFLHAVTYACKPVHSFLLGTRSPPTAVRPATRRRGRRGRLRHEPRLALPTDLPFQGGMALAAPHVRQPSLPALGFTRSSALYKGRKPHIVRMRGRGSARRGARW